MATLNVGSGQTYKTVASAVAASRDGDVIAVQAGTYVNDFVTIRTDISIVGVGGMANFVATTSPPNGKAIFVTQADVTVQNLSFSGAEVPDLNGAGIRHEAGNLTVIDSYFHDNQDGILATGGGTVRITGSEFAKNGAGDGYSHNLYVGPITALIIDDSYFHDASVGHQVKSRAHTTTITNSRIYDDNGTGSYSIDIPDGGVAVIQGNIIQQGTNSANPTIIHYGGENAAYAGSSITVSGNVIVNDMTSSSSVRALANATSVTATVSGNEVYGLTSGQILSGPGNASATGYLSARPSLNSSAPWLDDGNPNPTPPVPPTPTPPVPPTPTPPLGEGTSGADTLSGTPGANTLAGGAGDDEYVVNHARDVVVEASGGGTDHVTASVDFTLPGFVEDLTLIGGARYGTGNSLANVITGSGANDVLAGLGGNDTLVGAGGADQLDGGTGNDRLYGGGGNDTMTGGTGNDDFVVNNAGDIVLENANGGTDRILTWVNYTLAANVENLSLLGSNGIDGTGNDLANTIRGNAAANLIDGAGGNDLLYGNAGGDTLIGGAGNDFLNGGAGADSMVGGTGDDIYWVDAVGDRIVEGANAGRDVIQSSVTYTLPDNVEVLNLTGSLAINGTGTQMDDLIYGNDGANWLSGLGGDDYLTGGNGGDTLVGGAGDDVLVGGGGGDSLIGGAGDDRYYALDSARDIVVEEANGGIDVVTSYVSYTLTANVENLWLLGTNALNGTGNDLANVINGNDAANRLSGAGGNDMLQGGLGADTLTGGSGSDHFRFASAAEGGDVITDFNPIADTIQISRGGFGIDFAIGALADTLLHDGSAASGGGAQFLYDDATGVLRFDADGAGGAGATVLATLTGAPALTAGDISIIA